MNGLRAVGVTRGSRFQGRHVIAIARRVFIGAAVFFLFAGGSSSGPTADAADGTAGPVSISVVKSEDGSGAVIHAEATDGVLIYEIAAHLCLTGSNVRTVFDFNFQGTKCTSVPVGDSDVEQIVSYPDGSPTADIPYFRLGTGTVLWRNSRGGERMITCGPGQPCDVVVQVQITDGSVRFPATVCFDLFCPAGTVGETPPPPPTEPPPAETSPPPVAAGNGDDAAKGDGAKGDGAQGDGSAKKPTSGTAAPKQGDRLAAGSSSSSSEGDPEAETAAALVSSDTADDGPSRATRVRAAAIAGLAGGVLIMGLISRGRHRMEEAR